MLSASKAITSEQAESYYTKEDSNYWEKDASESSYYGNSLKDFELEEGQNVDAQSFSKLTKGINPLTDEKILSKSKVSGESRAGFDFVFKAPKSVSILCDVCGDEKLQIAHNEAVKEALDYMQKNLSQSREYIFGVREKVNVNNLTIAQFEHHTTRSLDPSLHTHNFIFNFVKGTDGKYRSIEPNLLYQNQRMLGQAYQNALASKVKELGYKIEWKQNDKNLNFEIKGVDENIIKNFSKRHEQFLKKLEELKANPKYSNLTQKELENKAVLFSRDAKQDLSKEAIKENWENELKELGISKEQILQNSKTFEQGIENVITKEELLDVAIAATTENESVFYSESFLLEALKLSKGNYKLEELEDAFNSRIRTELTLKEKYDIIQVEKNTFTSKEVLDAEKRILDIARETIATNTQEFNLQKAESLIEKYQLENDIQLTVGQSKTVATLLSSKDKLNLVQGVAGSGKTKMLEVLKKLSNKEIIGISTTGKAATEIQSESGIESKTIDSFLNNYVPGSLEDKTIVIDEASMVGTLHFEKILDIAKSENARVIAIGDSSQLAAVAQGSMFIKLQKQDFINVSIMEQSLRQKTELTKEIVQDIRNKNVVDAMSKLEKNNYLHTNQNIDNLKFDISEKVSNEIRDGKDSVALVNTNKERTELNEFIKKDLQNLMVVDRENHNFEVLKRLNQTSADKVLSESYKVGNIVTNNKVFMNIRPGTQMQILQINNVENKIKVRYLSSSTGEKAAKDEANFKWIDLYKHGIKLNQYEKEHRDFSVNQKIIFEQNTKLFKNGDVGTIKNIDKNFLDIELKGKLIRVDADKYKYLDHGYSFTSYKSQGQSIQFVHILVDAHNEVMNTLNSMYVFASRVKEKIELYTNDKMRIIDQFSNESVKSNAIDFGNNIRRYNQSNKFKHLEKNDYHQLYSEIKHIDFGKTFITDREEDFHKLFTVIEKAKEKKDIDMLIKSYKLDSGCDKSQMIKDYAHALNVNVKDTNHDLWIDNGGEVKDFKGFGENLIKNMPDYQEQFINKFTEKISTEYILQVSDKYDSHVAEGKFQDFEKQIQEFKTSFILEKNYQKTITEIEDHLNNGNFKQAKELMSKTDLDKFDKSRLDDLYEKSIDHHANYLDDVKKHIDMTTELQQKSYSVNYDDTFKKAQENIEKQTLEKEERSLGMDSIAKFII